MSFLATPVNVMTATKHCRLLKKQIPFQSPKKISFDVNTSVFRIQRNKKLKKLSSNKDSILSFKNICDNQNSRHCGSISRESLGVFRETPRVPRPHFGNDCSGQKSDTTKLHVSPPEYRIRSFACKGRYYHLSNLAVFEYFRNRI